MAQSTLIYQFKTIENLKLQIVALNEEMKLFNESFLKVSECIPFKDYMDNSVTQDQMKIQKKELVTLDRSLANLMEILKIMETQSYFLQRRIKLDKI